MRLECKKTNQHIHFEIPERYNKIGINLSGGADSAILLLMTVKYLMDKKSDATLTILTCSNDLKARWNGRRAADVIEYVIRKTGFTNIDMHYTYYRDRQDEKYFHEVETRLFIQRKLELMLSGITSNPPLNTIVEASDGRQINLDLERVSERDGNMHTEMAVTGMTSYYNPFINVNKKFIASMYEQYDAMDLLDITRSCENRPESYDMQYLSEFEETACGKCWWCLEKKWGFGKF